MKEKKVQFDALSLHYSIEGNIWTSKLAKSVTQVKNINQVGLLTESSPQFVPVNVEEEEDFFRFSFTVNEDKKQWNVIKKLPRNEKLRLLCNVAELDTYLSTRITFFLHSENLVFDDNLRPIVIHRGIRNLVPPFELDEQLFLRQLKCYVIALFSKTYTFDDLYNGALKNVKGTEFEKQVSDAMDLAQLKKLLHDSFKQEQKKTEKTMVTVPVKRFRLFKQLSIIMITVAILLAGPLVYYGFVKVPFQEKLLTSHGHYLASDYGSVISTLRRENAERLPSRVKFILAYSYIQVENLSDREKEVIMRNISLRSDENYLLYWIYNGRGNFEESIEKAKYLDDPQLVMYGLIKQIEQARNNPELTGSERDELIKQLQDELNRYRDEYHIETDDETLTEQGLGGQQQLEETPAGLSSEETKQQEREEDSDEAVENN